MSFICLSCVYLLSLKFSLLCVHVCKMYVCVGGCYAVYVKIRGHLSEAGSLPFLHGSQEWSSDRKGLSSPRHLRQPFIFFREMSVKC